MAGIPGLAFVANIGWRALAGKAVSNAAGDVRAVGRWIGGLDLVHLLLLVVCIALAVDHVALIISHRHSAKVEGQLSKSESGRADDRAAYAKAQADAAATNLAHVAADKAARERITHDVSQSYQAQLVSLRTDLARRLRTQGSPAQGASRPTDLPGVSPAPSGPDGSARLSIPSALYVRGAELELQLERLQQWIAEQVKVDPNEKAKP